MPYKRIPIGVDNFGELVAAKNNYLFVDKTLLIKEILDDGSKTVLITRPRRWGKTLNLSMLQYFLADEIWNEKTAGLFDTLELGLKHPDYIKAHQGLYSVILVSFKDVKEFDFPGALANLRGLVKELYREHRAALLSSSRLDEMDKQIYQQYLEGRVNQQELESALRFLSECLFRHTGKKVYILIDEYDTPLNAGYGKYLNEIAVFMKNLFGSTLKNNVFLEKGIMTGILRLSKESMLSGLNHLSIYTLLQDNRYAPYFGFTEKEVDRLFDRMNFLPEENPLRSEKRQAVKNWYNGYHIHACTLYNPWSILNCISHQTLGPYWLNTADDNLLKEVLQNSSVSIKEQFQCLLLEGSISVLVSETCRFEDLLTDETSLWSLLLHAGYLTLAPQSQVVTEAAYYHCQLSIPNTEVQGIYISRFIEWLGTGGFAAKNILKAFFELLLEGQVDECVTQLESYLQNVASIHDYAQQPEAFYHGFMLAISAALLDTYFIFSNREAGLGRPDLVYIPKNSSKTRAIILEFKPLRKGQKPQTIAKQALQQIKEGDYIAAIHQYPYIKQVLALALVFDGKKIHHCSEQLP